MAVQMTSAGIPTEARTVLLDLYRGFRSYDRREPWDSDPDVYMQDRSDALTIFLGAVDAMANAYSVDSGTLHLRIIELWYVSN